MSDETAYKDDCVFCKIIAKEIPAKIEYEDDLCISFHDINPRAKVHLLVIPKKHISTIKDLKPEDEQIAGRLLEVAREVAARHNLDAYRLLISVGKAAGQEVFHVHMHVMSPN
jgi:histidine triad (HIT) family protein